MNKNMKILGTIILVVMIQELIINDFFWHFSTSKWSEFVSKEEDSKLNFPKNQLQ